MDRFAIFVDAGYLYAEGGKLCHETEDRLKLELNFREAVSALAKIGRDHSGMQYLRTYWYDAATDAGPTASHTEVASIPGVKLRLGKLSLGRQKGVDSRIVRDLIVLSRDRAIAAAYVLSGDEDIREGVAEAQDQGISVVLLGISPLPGQYNQARSLVQEADDLVRLSSAQVSQWITLRPTATSPLFSSVSVSAFAAGPDMEQTGKRFGAAWADANPGLVSDLLMSRPGIPSEVDRELLHYGSAETGETLTVPERYSIRAGFWAALEERVAVGAQGL